MFPYYIVRFKHMRRYQYSDHLPEFPYYIVRFKQNKATMEKKKESGFHTT